MILNQSNIVKMVDYSKAKIYKLVCDDLVYYGSTVLPLNRRENLHRSDFRHRSYGCCTSKLLFEKNFDGVKIELVENYPCKNKQELQAREKWYIENNECVNSHLKKTELEKRELRKQVQAKYVENNREKIREYKSKYRQENKEKIKEYFVKNRDVLKAKRQEKITCDCGSIVCRGHLPKHKKSKKHIEYISNLTP